MALSSFSGLTATLRETIEGALQRTDDITGTIITRYGTTAELGDVTPQLGELVINTDLNTLVRGDGVTLGGISLIPNLNSGSSVVVTPSGDSLTANGDLLRAGLAAVNSLTPYGNAKSAQNRATLCLLPGIYDIRSAGTGLLFDTEFVDIVGLCENAEDVVIWVDSGVSRIITQTADDCHLSGFTVYHTNNNPGFAMNGTSHANTKHTNLFFTGAVTQSACMSYANFTNLGGTYRRCRTTQTRMYGGLTDGTTCDAVFEECEGLMGSLGSSVSNLTFVNFSGRHSRCRLMPGGAAGSITCVAGAVIEFGYYKTNTAVQSIFKATGAGANPVFRYSSIISTSSGYGINRKSSETDATIIAHHLSMAANGIHANVTNNLGNDAAAFNIASANIG